MERTKETLEARVRETPLVDRLKECQQRIGNMCAELRGPKMSIPVEYYDDDFYICTTLADAQATVEALQRERDTARRRVDELEAREVDVVLLRDDLDAERDRLARAIVWALGYTDFRAREQGEGAYWWRTELRLRAKLTGEQIDAILAALTPAGRRWTRERQA